MSISREAWALIKRLAPDPGSQLRYTVKLTAHRAAYARFSRRIEPRDIVVGLFHTEYAAQEQA